MHYLRFLDEGFGFVADGIHDILDTDVAITDEDYASFFNRQQTESFRKKAELPTSGGLFDYVESYIPEAVDAPAIPTEYERMQVALAESFEKQEADKLELQLALAELIELASQPKGGE